MYQPFSNFRIFKPIPTQTHHKLNFRKRIYCYILLYQNIPSISKYVCEYLQSLGTFQRPFSQSLTSIRRHKSKKRIPMLTLVEVGECFIVQFNGGRGSCTQNILKGEDLIVAVWRQAGLLLLENGEGKNIAGEGRQNNSVIQTRSPRCETFHQTSSYFNCRR